MLRAWGALPRERRLAAYGALGLFFTLFLPWYHETVLAAGTKPESASLTGWQAFSFAEAVLLLVAAGVLTLLFHRAEGRAVHVPGGDGWGITVAGFGTCVLVIWRIFDKQTVHVSAPGTAVSGVEWGIFVALGVSALLAYAGSRIRAAETPAVAASDDATGPERQRGSRSPANGNGRPGRKRPAPPPVRSPRPVRSSGVPLERFGPRVVPEDPPTLRIGRPAGHGKAAAPAVGGAGLGDASDAPAVGGGGLGETAGAPAAGDEQLTIPLDEIPPAR